MLITLPYGGSLLGGPLLHEQADNPSNEQVGQGDENVLCNDYSDLLPVGLVLVIVAGFSAGCMLGQEFDNNSQPDSRDDA